MGLIFQRLARNFIKNGYFPTDEVTIGRILNAIDIGGPKLRILDPCCGEGVALAEIKHHLVESGAVVEALGIEYDADRAWHSKQILDRVAHSDMNDVNLTLRSCSLLFLNPPYGNAVTDKAQTGEQDKSDRLEKIFYRRTVNWLQFGGVMVLIVPYYVLDAEFSQMIARHFDRVQVFMAPEQKFKQAVIFGVKRRADRIDLDVAKRLEAVSDKNLPPELPENWILDQYQVPAVTDDANFVFTSVRIDAPQLADELTKHQHALLWPQFGTYFHTIVEKHRRPLRDMSKWHLALALAAGQISGVVESAGGRRLLIKGDTFKAKDKAVEMVEKENGEIAETRIYTDKFVPVIRAIDFTSGPTFGEIVTVR